MGQGASQQSHGCELIMHEMGFKSSEEEFGSLIAKLYFGPPTGREGAGHAAAFRCFSATVKLHVIVML